MADPVTCVRCAAVGPTCCNTDPARTDLCFPLSGTEAERLRPFAEKLGVPAGVAEGNTRDFIRAMRNLFPDRLEELGLRFPEGGQHLRLALDEHGGCLFLQPEGCALPRSARPWYCQLFPIWIHKGFFDYFTPQACLIAREAGNLRDVFAAAGLDPEEAKAIYISLCRDWEL